MQEKHSLVDCWWRGEGEIRVADVGGGGQQAVIVDIRRDTALILLLIFQIGAVAGDIVVIFLTPAVRGTGGLEGSLHLSVALQALVEDVLQLLPGPALHLLPVLQPVKDLLHLVPEPVHLNPLHRRALPGRHPLHVGPEVPPGW